MKNISVKQEGNRLLIECELDKDFGDSKSGKTKVVASSEGNQPVGTHKNGKVVVMGLNLYYKP